MLQTESRGVFVRKQDGGETLFTVGSTNAGGVRLALDGDSNGDATGYDYAYLQHDTDGDFIISADNPNGDAEMIFKVGNSNEKMRLTSSGQLLLTAATGTSVALLKAAGTNTDLRVASVGTGGFFDVQTQGVDNRMRVDANGHFYTNQQRTKLSYGGATACSLRWNITSGKNLAQNNANRDNYGKLNIQAGRANSTSVNDDCVAIRITPAEVRATAVGTKSCGIGFNHLNADTWPNYSGNQVWMGLSLHDTPGQERDRFQIWNNTGYGQGDQPNQLGFSMYPNGVVSLPKLPCFSVYKYDNSNQVSSGVYIFNTVVHNNGSHYNSSNGRFTAPVDGYYFFYFVLQGYGGGTGGRHVRIQVNGTDYWNQGTNTPFYDEMAGAHGNFGMGQGVYMSADDYATVVSNAQHRGMQSGFSGFLVG